MICNQHSIKRPIPLNSRYEQAEIPIQSPQFQYSQSNLFKDSLKTSLNSRRVGTLNLGLALTTVVEVEGRHSGDTVGSSDLSELIDVDLVEAHVGVGLAELLQLRGDSLAGTAPDGVEVDDDGAGGVGDFGLVVLDAGIVS
jgi:hypothetical protein